ncbi:MAG: alpha/beta hydrolase-fold protein [Ferruginibacter sp.]
MRYIFVTILLAFQTHLFAQKDTVIFILVDNAGGSPDYFLAGNMNGWKPDDTAWRFKKDQDGTQFLSCIFDKGSQLEFKFTRGGWERSECNSSGAFVANRQLKTDTASMSVYYVAGWTDKFAQVTAEHTASKNVSVLDTAFYIPQLNRHRRIWIYLPADYAKTGKHFPVMYLQDGQNLFDKATAYSGEWGVDEIIDSLVDKGKPGCIVVGIDNGGQTRMNEYSPYDFTWRDSLSSKTFSAEGDAYLAFITATLKPYIDKKFRTLPSRENTVIGGSSMGGLISYYAALKYPDVFGKAGVFSPSFWISPAINSLTDAVAPKINGKFFFYAGDMEGGGMTEEMYDIAENLGANSAAMILTVVDKAGQHNEAYWNKWFTEFYTWIMADGYNIPLKLDD